jgi:hypothetical protein
MPKPLSPCPRRSPWRIREFLCRLCLLRPSPQSAKSAQSVDRFFAAPRAVPPHSSVSIRTHPWQNLFLPSPVFSVANRNPYAAVLLWRCPKGPAKPEFCVTPSPLPVQTHKPPTPENSQCAPSRCSFHLPTLYPLPSTLHLLSSPCHLVPLSPCHLRLPLPPPHPLHHRHHLIPLLLKHREQE